MTSINFTKLTQELSNAVKSIENSVDELKTMVSIMPETEKDYSKYKQDQEIFEKELKSMKINDINLFITSLGNVMISKSYLDNLTEEINEYKNSFKIKLDIEVKNIQEKLQLQLQNQLNMQKIHHEKDIGILNAELNFNKEKLKYMCFLNNIIVPDVI